jgi:hypothetical protein
LATGFPTGATYNRPVDLHRLSPSPVMSPRDSSSESVRNFGTALAMVMVLVIALGLFYLVATVFPSIAGLLIVGLLFVLPALFHYFVWGRWMERVRQRVLAEEARTEAEAKLRKGR